MTRLALAAFVLAAAVAPAAAQVDPGVFVTGAVFAGVERVSHAEIEAPFFESVDLSDTVIGWSVGLGTFVHPAWSVRFEFAAPGELDEEVNTFDLGGGVSVGPRSVHTLRTYSGSALIGHHLALSSRVSVGLLGGVVFGRRETRSVTDFSFILPPVPAIPGLPFPDLLPIRSESKTTSYHAGAGLGLDVDWALVERIIVSPHVRAHVLSGALSLRPGLGLRFNF